MAKGTFQISTGLTIRVIAALVIASSVPFLAIYPTNTIAQIIFGFGNFLLVLGANLK